MSIVIVIIVIIIIVVATVAAVTTAVRGLFSVPPCQYPFCAANRRPSVRPNAALLCAQRPGGLLGFVDDDADVAAASVRTAYWQLLLLPLPASGRLTGSGGVHLLLGFESRDSRI